MSSSWSKPVVTVNLINLLIQTEISLIVELTKIFYVGYYLWSYNCQFSCQWFDTYPWRCGFYIIWDTENIEVDIDDDHGKSGVVIDVVLLTTLIDWSFVW